MYLPAHFEETDPHRVRELLAAYPLATLVAQGGEGLVANHLPMHRNEDGNLIGHVAIANSLHEQLADGQEVLAIFRGEDGYISPQWYPSKKEHHRHVPTWNYQVAHVHGKIHFQHDERSKRAVVSRLTRHHETETNGDDAWKMSDAPADYMENMLAAIVAFRIDVERVVAKAKLSQNREPADFDGVTEVLEQRGSRELAQSMREWQKHE